jgi:hypothetical protein
MTEQSRDPRFSPAVAARVLDALDLVAAVNVEFWPGAWGEHEGFTNVGGGKLSAPMRAALDHAWHAQLIAAPDRDPYYAPRLVQLTATGRRWLDAQRERAAAST